jgi:hypothetical protein
MPNVETLLRDHVTLNIDCIDRLYLNGYVELLQRPQNLWWFLHEHLGFPVVSPQLLKRLVDRFVGSIHSFADRHRVPVVHFDSKQRKEEVVPCQNIVDENEPDLGRFATVPMAGRFG